MRVFQNLFLGGCFASLLLSGCIDNDYDLSDVDTNVSVQVNDLIIPVNLDVIKLKSVIDLNEDDAVRIVDGQYVALLEGALSSSEVGVERFWIPKPADESKLITVPVSTNAAALRADAPLLTARISSAEANVEVSMSATGIDPAIQTLDTLDFNSDFEIVVSASGLAQWVDGFTLQDFELNLPPNCDLTVSDNGEYNSKTGLVTFPGNLVVNGISKVLHVHMRELQADQAGIELVNQSMDYRSDCNASGVLAVYNDQLKPGVDAATLLGLTTVQYRYGVTFEGDIEVTSVSGEVDYRYPDMYVSPIKLDDMPDMLMQPGTKVVIENPQIYVSMNNPMYTSGVNAAISLSLSPEPASLLNFETALKTYGEQNVFCLSPSKPSQYYSSDAADYSQAIFQPFENLGSVLAGDGLPQLINVDVTATVKQRVSNFQLGDYGAVEGYYTFYAPLELTPGSEVFYTDTIADWNDEELDAVTIRRLRITAEVVKDIPYAIELTVLPIDVQGNVINNLKTTAVLGAKTDEAIPLDVVLNGEIRHLDGIILKAHVKADQADILTPEMWLKVSNVRVTATGSYDKEL